MPDAMVGEMVAARLPPTQPLDMAIDISIVRGALMTVIAYPTLVAVFAQSPLDERRFADPGIVVILADIAIGIVINGVQGLRVAFAEHDQIRVGQRVHSH